MFHPDPPANDDTKGKKTNHVQEFAMRYDQEGQPPPRSGHRNCRNVPERFAGTL